LHFAADTKILLFFCWQQNSYSYELSTVGHLLPCCVLSIVIALRAAFLFQNFVNVKHHMLLLSVCSRRFACSSTCSVEICWVSAYNCHDL